MEDPVSRGVVAEFEQLTVGGRANEHQVAVEGVDTARVSERVEDVAVGDAVLGRCPQSPG